MGDSHNKVTRHQLECIGKILVDVWGLKLRSNFPNLDIHIELQGLDSEDDLDIMVVFWAE